MSEKKMMGVEDFRMLNDYLKTLTHAQSDGVKVGNELQQVIKKINEGLGLESGKHRSNYKNANNENVATEWSQVGDEVFDVNQIKLNQVSTKHLYDELLNRKGIDEHIVKTDGKAELSIDNGVQGYNIEIRGASRIMVNKN